ncbi:MAG: alpha/beta hydrolase-fold protein [Terricaulis silvestris]
MLRFAVLLLCLALAAPAFAQTPRMATQDEIASETQRFLIEGPQHDQRIVSVWRPANAGDTPLPVLYVADGTFALYTFVAWLKPAIERGEAPPIMAVGFDPDPAHRSEEYIPHWPGGRTPFATHEAWFLNVIIPWAEQNVYASPNVRAIVGVSNGADFAVAMAAAHPDLFIGIVAHSPLGTNNLRVSHSHAGQRWVLSAGRPGQERIAAANVERIAAAIHGAHGAVRICMGPWGHDMNAWRDLSPGETLWALGLAAGNLISPQERQYCGPWSANDAAALLDGAATHTKQSP